jgi:hypothetical protein
MTYTELQEKVEKGELHLHHTASKRGYLSRKNNEPRVHSYTGKFGKGYTAESPRWDTTQYITVQYFTS